MSAGVNSKSIQSPTRSVYKCRLLCCSSSVLSAFPISVMSTHTGSLLSAVDQHVFGTSIISIYRALYLLLAKLSHCTLAAIYRNFLQSLTQSHIRVITAPTVDIMRRAYVHICPRHSQLVLSSHRRLIPSSSQSDQMTSRNSLHAILTTCITYLLGFYIRKRNVSFSNIT